MSVETVSNDVVSMSVETVSHDVVSIGATCSMSCDVGGAFEKSESN